MLEELAAWKIRAVEAREGFLKTNDPAFYEKAKNVDLNFVQFFHPEYSIATLEEFYDLFQQMKPVNGAISKYSFKNHFRARGIPSVFQKTF